MFTQPNGNYAEAISHYEKSIKLNEEKVRDYKELTFACSNLAIAHSDFENNLKAEYWFTMAQHWMKQAKIDPIRSAQILQNFASVLTKRFEIDKSLGIYQQALHVLEPWKQDRADLYAQILINMAMSYIHLNQPDKAEPIDILLDQLAPTLKSSWPDQYELYLLWKVLKLKSSGQFDQALQISNQLEQNYVGVEMNDRMLNIIEQKAVCLNNLKQYKESLSYYKRVKAYYQNHLPHTHPLIITSLNNIGAIFLYENKPDSARYYFELAKQNNLLPSEMVLSEDNRFSSKVEWIVSNYHLLQLAMNSFRDGLINIQQLELSESLILSTLSILDSKRIELTLEGDRINFNRFARDFFDEAMEFYYLLNQTNPAYINKAFLISEKAKYQALHKAIGLDRLNNFTRVATKVSDEEKKLSTKVAQLEYQVAQEIAKNGEPVKELLHEYEQEWMQTTARLNYLIDSIKQKLPDYYDLKFNKTIVEINQLRNDLFKAHDAPIWVSYYMGDKITYAIVITASKTSFIKLGDSQEIRKQLKALNNFASQFTPSSEDIRNISGKLYAVLLKPVKASLSKAELKTKKIVIIPDDALNHLNFELLINSEGKVDFSYALYDNLFSYGFSSTLLWMTFGENAVWKLEEAKLLGFAPEFETDRPAVAMRDSETEIYNTFGFRPLQKNQEEVKQISSIANQKKLHTQIYLGKTADETTLKKTNLDQFDIIHFATHGFTDAGKSGAAGIAFARNSLSKEDDILFMDEVFNLRNNAHLVCLSACETGRGQNKTGEGLLGLTRAFLYSGTRNLVVSLWKVEDESTSMLMKDFYSAFVNNSNIAESLRAAKIKMLKRNPALPPAYWAAFIHIGLD